MPGKVFGDFGLVCPCQDAQAVVDAIVELADNPERRKKLGTNARKSFLSIYGREGNVAKAMELLEQVCRK